MKHLLTLLALLCCHIARVFPFSICKRSVNYGLEGHVAATSVIGWHDYAYSPLSVLSP